MAKSPHSAEWKLKVIEEYLSGQGSYISLAKMYGIGTTTLRSWVSSNRRSLPKVWKPLISGHLRPVIHLFVTSILRTPRGSTRQNECHIAMHVRGNISTALFNDNYYR